MLGTITTAGLVQYALLGLGTGAVYALLGQGIIVIYRGSGIVNFAHGALGMTAAFIFVDLHDEKHWSFWPAAILAVLVVAAIGALFHLLVMRPLRKSSPLTRLIATLGLLSFLTGGVGLYYFTEFRATFPFLPQHPWDIHFAGLNMTLSSDRMYLFFIACALTVVLYVFYHFTRFGLAVSATAESETNTAALGWSPDLIASINWAIGSALAGVAGILIVPITGLQVSTLTLLVIAALAAALVGGFSSFPMTLLGGVIIGAIQSIVTFYGLEIFGQTGSVGVAPSLPFFAIVIVLVVRGKGLPLRSHLLERLPALGAANWRLDRVAIATAAVSACTIGFFGHEVVHAVVAMTTAGILILSLIVLTGYAGQVSLGQYALAGIAALFAGRLVSAEGWPFELALLTGVVVATVVGVAFALPALRTRGVNLAVITLGLGAAIRDMVLSNGKYTGGLDGTPVPKTTFLGITIDPVGHEDRYAVFCLIWLVVLCFLVTNLRRSRAGRRLISMRTNERAAASLGISVFGAKFYAFAVSGAIAGIGGVLIAFQFKDIVYEGTYDPLVSINGLLQSVLGGIGYVLGAAMGSGFAPGAIGEVAIKQLTTDPGQWLVMISGLFVMFFLIVHPDGAANFMVDHVLPEKRRKRAEKRARAAQEAPAAEAEAGRMRIATESLASAVSVRPAVLEVRDLELKIGAIEILRGIDLSVQPGEIVGLIGPNGAGKTMFIDSVTGFVKPTGGSVLFDGAAINGWSAPKRARAGLARSFQSLELFEDVTIRENLQAASDERDRAAYLTTLFRRDRRPLQPGALAAIAEFGLDEVLDRYPTELPYGQRRLVAIARSIAMQPSVLLLDEPAAGLSEVETAEFSDLVRRLAKEWGIGILLIEHDMSMVMGLCDRIVVIDFGEKIAEGAPEQIRADARVVAAYLGEAVEASAGGAPAAAG